MNLSAKIFTIVMASWVLVLSSDAATVITNNFGLTPADTSLEGSDLVISNCTVTMDGAHSFNSLTLGTGGSLTCTANPSGSATLPGTVTNEQFVLSGTNPYTLFYSYVSGGVTLTDSNQDLFTNGADFVQTTLGNQTQIARTTNSIIPNGATVIASYAWSITFNTGLNISLTNNLNVAAGGSINVSGGGYSGINGPGYGNRSINSPNDSSGGGHGGSGGMSVSNAPGGGCYGSLYQPTTLGSGGGPTPGGNGGSGGGRIQISAGGNVNVDGAISANGAVGTNSRSGGGAGGSIWIVASNNVSGAGSLTANGGEGEPPFGGGGGGGRISIQCGKNIFSGGVTAYGGSSGKNGGGAGTVFIQTNGQTGQLVLDNGGLAGTNSVVTLSSIADVLVQHGAWLTPAASTLSPRNLTIGTNGILAMATATALTLNISGNCIIQSGGALLADTNGSPSSTGSSSSGGGNYSIGNGNYDCAGGGHGGYGGISGPATAGAAFDNATSPTGFGGGGGGMYSPTLGGAGGGSLQIGISGNLQVDGKISANGGNGSGLGGGGGAGGSIYIQNCNLLTGAGSITASGGNGVPVLGGGGGGGRIAVYFNTNHYTGTFSVTGGSGTNYGGAGTIYFKTNSAINGQVVMDNGGNPGGYSTFTASSTTDLTLRNGAVCLQNSSANFGNLIVSSNAILYATNAAQSQITLTAASINVQAGGWISSDSGGYGGGSGLNNGAGNSGSANAPYYACSGAGHGGYGGNATNFAGFGYGSGGYAYDTQNGPTSTGSGGGTYSPYSMGGRGGGALKLVVQGNVQVDGTISANAGNGTGIGGGGGSGGSIYISSTTLAGAGSLNASGGNGASSQAGGGAGGIIYAIFNSSSFSGNATAYGGAGCGNGGAGTIYYQTNSAQALLIVDNGGRRGSTNTPVSNFNNNWIIRNGGSVQPSISSFTLDSLLIGTNAILSPSGNGGGFTVTVNGNTTIQQSGAIFADNFGNTQNNGTGHGSGYFISPYFPSGGGGHGGYGGMGITNQGAGGITYDSSATPTQAGSGGGSYNTSAAPGGNGGGFVRLNVNGNLQLDGSISANGGSGLIGGGGGSGGGIYLNVYSSGTFKGAGSLSANGGLGGAYGGGGGGGRIAVYYFSNNVEHSTFNGPITAYGGTGANNGGAGTLYVQNSSQGYSQLILDNGGNAGTNTTFDNTYCDATVQNKAVGVMPGTIWPMDILVIHTNGVLVNPTTGPNLHTINAYGVTIDSGGAISLDTGGYPASTGPGAAQTGGTIHGGGGHGGYGGGDMNGTGSAYDSITTPSTPGSGGAGASGINGGAGGGALTLSVSSILTVNGRISANGGNGDPGGGGGAGGGIYFQSINTITGSGVISANGGSGIDGPTGGGAGGRIAVVANTSTFTGQMSATGGGGTYPGGAGTIYKRILGYPTLTIDNGGIAGTNTPLTSSFGPPSTPYDLNIANSAIVAASSPLPLLNNFNLAAGGTLISTSGAVFISVRTNATILGSIIEDNRGYSQGNGPGFGTNLNFNGSGGGYGGAGGIAASGAIGGITNGSAAQPTDFGSGGGSGVNTVTGGSEGGGAVRLSVGGNLNLGGTISANGDYGWQDNSGGGAGGSIWIAANSIIGAGNLSVAGGNGDLWNGGGGGGGGRIAIYSPANLFTGTTNISGGLGYANGQNGTFILSSSLLNFSVAAMSPTGLVNNTVSSVTFTFSDVVDPNTVSANCFTLTTPAGTVDPSNFTVTVTGVASTLSFPQQTTPGAYTVTAAAPIASILGQQLQSFSGGFSISLPTVSGNVSDTNDAPVAGVSLQPSGGLPATMTDVNGNYSIPVPPGWTIGITPSLGQLLFVPGTLNLTNVTASLTNQNFIAYQTLSPVVTSGFDGVNVTLSWQSISNVTYSVLDSTDLMNWVPYSGTGSVITGTNGLMEFIDPVNFSSPQLFYQLNVTH